MIIKCNAFWSYIINEPNSTLERIKSLLTLEEYDYKSETYNRVKFYVEEQSILDFNKLRFPTGLCDYLLSKLNLDIDYQKDFDDEYSEEEIRQLCNEIAVNNPKFEVRDYQVESVLAGLNRYQALILSSVASGKTSMMSITVRLLINRGYKILITNDSGFILKQINDRLISLGVDPTLISMDINNLDAQICILTSDILYSHIKKNDQNLLNYLSNINAFIVDEAQHMQSMSGFAPLFYTTIGTLKHVIGYSGSPFRNHKFPYKNNMDFMTIALLGEPAFVYDMDDAINNENIAKVYSYFINYNSPKSYMPDYLDYFVLYKKNIQNNAARNRSGLEMIKFLNKHNLKTLVLFNYIDKHALPIMKQLKQEGVKALMIRGGAGTVKGIPQGIIYEYDDKLKKHERKGSIDDLVKAMEEDNYNIIFASSILNEGVDIECFDAGLLFAGGKSPISLIQQVGRVSRRKKNGMNVSLIIDFKDINCNGMFVGQYNKRKQLMRDKGVQNIENVQDFCKLVEEISRSKINK